MIYMEWEISCSWSQVCAQAVFDCNQFKNQDIYIKWEAAGPWT